MKVASRLTQLKKYPFAILEDRVARLQREGRDVIDLGVGSPKLGVPDVVVEAVKRAVEEHRYRGYPTYEGNIRFREAAAQYIRDRFGVRLDPEKNIIAAIGSKELVFHLPFALLDPGDVALVTSPGYAPAWRGVHFAGGHAHILPLTESAGFLPALDSVGSDVLARARYLYINYPNNPTTRCAPREFLQEARRFAEKHGLWLISDEAYIDIWHRERPVSALELGCEGVLSVFSLSKRSMMANYRIGFAAGDERLIGALRRLKTNIDSGPPDFVQDAAAAALLDTEHTETVRRRWSSMAQTLIEGLREGGLEPMEPEGTFYIWCHVGGDDVDFALSLLERTGVVCMPGSWLCAGGDESGAGWVRFALVEPPERIEEAASRIASR